MTTEALTERCMSCTLCDWLTFPLTPEEAAEAGYCAADGTPWSAEHWFKVAQGACAIHIVLKHPKEFGEDIRNPEEALADYEEELGEWFEMAKFIALYDRDRWDA